MAAKPDDLRWPCFAQEEEPQDLQPLRRLSKVWNGNVKDVFAMEDPTDEQVVRYTDSQCRHSLMLSGSFVIAVDLQYYGDGTP